MNLEYGMVAKAGPRSGALQNAPANGRGKLESQEGFSQEMKYMSMDICSVFLATEAGKHPLMYI